MPFLLIIVAISTCLVSIPASAMNPCSAIYRNGYGDLFVRTRMTDRFSKSQEAVIVDALSNGEPTASIMLLPPAHRPFSKTFMNNLAALSSKLETEMFNRVDGSQGLAAHITSAEALIHFKTWHEKNQQDVGYVYLFGLSPKNLVGSGLNATMTEVLLSATPAHPVKIKLESNTKAEGEYQDVLLHDQVSARSFINKLEANPQNISKIHVIAQMQHSSITQRATNIEVIRFIKDIPALGNKSLKIMVSPVGGIYSKSDFDIKLRALDTWPGVSVSGSTSRTIEVTKASTIPRVANFLTEYLKVYEKQVQLMLVSY